jgi:alpha-tubulin suppressor-like RCC1 family protein
MNRRHALSLLAAWPFAARVGAQTRITAEHRVFLSGRHGLLLGPDGTLQVWSMNPGRGEQPPAEDVLGLGDDRPIDHHRLYPVAGLQGVVAAAAGSASYAVLTDGRVFAWGATGSGELGITPRAEFEERAQPRMRTNTPTPVAVTLDAVNVSSTSDHVLALARDGSVWAWGRGDSGQLGIGPLPVVTFKTRSARVEPYVPYPVRVPDLEGVLSMGAGAKHSLALLKDGTVRAWGDNKWGQVGDGTTTNRDRPVLVPGVRNAVAVSAGAYFSLAVLSDGSVVEWGSTPGNVKPRTTTAPVPGVRGIRSAVAGGEHVVAITHNGEVMTWGQDAHYQTGRGREGPAPGLVKGVKDVKSVAASGGTTIVVLSSGRMLTWGEVREWTRPDEGGAGLSPFPILLWLDGLEYS